MSLYASHYPFTEIIRKLFLATFGSISGPRISGADYIPREGAFLLTANHSSHADTAIIFSALPSPLRQRVVAAAARDYFFEGGWQQSTARILFNAIPVDRETVKGEDPLRHVIRALDEGYGVVIYPEGTRSPTGKIGPFRRGIGRLIALFPDIPVIPMRLMGTAQAMPKGPPSLVRAPSMFVLAPLHLQADLKNRASWQAAANAVREAVLQLETKAA